MSFHDPHDSTHSGGIISPRDDRDFRADLLSGSNLVTTIPQLHRNRNFSILPGKDQGNSVACTAFTVTHALETANTREYGRPVVLDAWEQWNRQKEYPNTIVPQGDYLRSALKSCDKFGIRFENGILKIKGYAQVDISAENFKRWIASGFSLLVSVATTKPRAGETSWSVARKTGYLDLSGEPSGGHAFEIPNYSGNDFEATNSFGSNWGAFNNGSFRIRADHISGVREAWVVFDETDLEQDRIFLDIPRNHWAAEAIEQVVADGILKGSDSDSGKPARDRKSIGNIRNSIGRAYGKHT